MSRPHPAGLLFARLLPVLQADIQTILGALERCERLIVILDGLGSAPSSRRPWSCAQREAQARSALSASAGQRVTFMGLPDHLYQPARWVAALKAALAAANVEPDAVALIATQQDAASLALRGFSPRVRLEPAAHPAKAGEAGARADYLRGGAAWRSAVSSAVAAWLEAFRADAAMARLAEEQAWVDHLSESWRMAPYPPIFVTADAVVIASGHILMIHRRHAPAKDLWALPGGFVEQDETVVEAALRELGEETGIAVSRNHLRAEIRDTRVFDAPERSVRGRTITHGTLIDLGDARPPAVRAGDDAASAAWWTLERFAQSTDSIAEDHAWIVRALVPDLP
jgi:bifunctional NMN adenylyltransferase/nudix hydrolase